METVIIVVLVSIIVVGGLASIWYFGRSLNYVRDKGLDPSPRDTAEPPRKPEEPPYEPPLPMDGGPVGT